MNWTDIIAVFSTVLAVLSFYPLVKWLLRRLAMSMEPHLPPWIKTVLAPWLEDPVCQLSRQDKELLQAVQDQVNAISERLDTIVG